MKNNQLLCIVDFLTSLVFAVTFSETNSFSIIPSKNKLVNKELIVIVQSRPNAFEARQANRDTWIKTGKN